MMLPDVIDAYLTRQRSLGMRFDPPGTCSIASIGRWESDRSRRCQLGRSSTSSTATGR